MPAFLLIPISSLGLFSLYAGLTSNPVYFLVASVALITLLVKKNKVSQVGLLLIILFISIMYLRGNSEYIKFQHNEPQEYLANCRVSFIGEVVGDLVIQDDKVQAVMKTEKIDCKESNLLGNFSLRVSLPHYYQSFRDGDILSVSGNFKIPEPFETDTGRTFKYDKFLIKNNIIGTIGYPKIEFVGKNKTIRSYIFYFKNIIVDSIQRSLPYPYDGLVVGMILGVDGALGEGLEDAYRRAGLIHIVVLSGFNVTIIAEAIRKTMPFGYKTNLALSIVGIWIFAIMVGASATVVRASVMATIVLLVRGIKEDYSVNHSLWLAAIIMSMSNPWVLGYDPSFHLSFLATCGIVYLSPIVEVWLAKIPENFELRFTVAGTLATQIFVIPYLAYSMGEVSTASFVVNVLTVSLVPIIMLSGFVIFVIYSFSPYLATIPVLIAWLLVKYQLVIVEKASSFKYATLPLPSLSLHFILLAYLIIITLTIVANVNKAKKEAVV